MLSASESRFDEEELKPVHFFDEREFVRFRERKELPRFFYMEAPKKWEHDHVADAKRWKHVYAVLVKVAMVAMAILSISMPLAIHYLPTWIPFGVGIPTSISLFIVYAKLQSKVEEYKQAINYVRHNKESLNHYTFKSLCPIEHPPIDERLQSDLLLQQTLQIHPPQSAQQHIVLGETLDLEYSPQLAKYGACKLAGNTQLEEHWASVRNEIRAAKVKCGNGTPGYLKKMQKEVLNLAYGTANNIPYDKFDFPAATAQQKVEEVVGMFQGLYRFYAKLKKILYESGGLYSGFDHFLEGQEKRNYHLYVRLYTELKALFEEGEPPLETPFEFDASEQWCKKFIEIARGLSQQISPLIFLLERQKLLEQQKLLKRQTMSTGFVTAPFFNQWLEKNRDVDLKGANFLLAAFYIKKYKLKYSLFDLLSAADVLKKNVTEWVRVHPEKQLQEAEKKIDKLRRKKILSSTQLGLLAEWIKQHELVKEEKCIRLLEVLPGNIIAWLEKHPDMRFLTVVELHQRSLQMQQMLSDAQERLDALQITRVNSKESYAHFREELKRFHHEILTPLSDLVDQCGEASQAKLVFQAFFGSKPTLPFGDDATLSIEDKNLKRLDAKMVLMHRVRIGVVRVPVMLLMVVEAIFAFYFVTPWFSWSLCALTVVSEGISYYIDYRLKAMHKKKQRLKMHSIFKNYPDSDRIPGTQPQRAEVMRVQKKWGLDGIDATRASGGKITIKWHPQIIPSAPKVEDELNACATEIIALKRKKQNYEDAATRSEKLANEITNLQAEQPLLNAKWKLIKAALEGDHLRKSEESIHEIMGEVEHLILNTSQGNYQTASTDSLKNRLRALPIDTLLVYKNEIKEKLHRLFRAERSLQRLSDPEFGGSKADFESKIVAIDEQLIALETKKQTLQKKQAGIPTD